jgi:hypothetical protein
MLRAFNMQDGFVRKITNYYAGGTCMGTTPIIIGALMLIFEGPPALPAAVALGVIWS